MRYVPKTGINAGRRNLKRIKEYLFKNPDATGVEISKKLEISRVSVYNHLKKLR